MRFGESDTDLSVAALWLVIGGEVFHIEGQPSRQVLCLGNVTLNVHVQFTNGWLVRYRSYTCSRMSQPGELFGSRASRANRSSTTQSCFTAGDRICNIHVTIGLPNRQLFFTNLERQGLCLVFPPDGQVQTALVQPGHLVVLLPDASLDLVHDRRHAVVGQARVRATQASHLEMLTSDC